MQVYAAIRGHLLADVPVQASRAETLGYDGLTVNEAKLDPFVACTLAAEHTRRIQVATAIALAFPRSPMITAGLAWALQRFSGGRFELGLGTQVKGHVERRFSVPWTSPGPRLREYLLALRAIWGCWQNGTPLDFRGSFYTFTLMTPEFSPGPIDHPRIPIHVAAVNPYNLRLAGEVCDGVLLHSFCTPKYVAEVVLPNVEAGARASGRALEDVAITGGGFVAIGASAGEIASEVEETRRRIAFYASTRTYKPVMDVHGWGDVCVRLHEMSLRGEWREMPRLITDAMVEAFCIVGTFGQVAEKMCERYSGWATRVRFPLPSAAAAGEQALRRAIEALQGAERAS